jgi:hypothetical protein
VRVLFIDFDGVLHAVTGPPSSTKLFVWGPILDSMLSKYPDVKVVVHASARDHSSQTWIEERLGPLGERVIGLAKPKVPRWEAIKQYVSTNPQISDYRILDDMAGEFPAGLSELILCNPKFGLSDPIAQRKLQIWLQDK